MIDKIDLLSLETSVRSLIGEEIAKFWTQIRVFESINAEVLRLTRKVINLDRGYFEVAYNPTPATTITLPATCYLVRNVEILINGVWMQPVWITDHQRGRYQAGSFPSAVQFVGNTLVFEDSIGSASGLRIKYARIPNSLLYGATITGSTTTSLSLSGTSSIDDIYVGDRFMVLAGAATGQIRTITSFTAALHAIAFASITGLDDNTTSISWILPEPLDKYPDVVALGAAVRLLGRRRDTELSGELRGEYDRDVSEMLDTLGQRQTEQVMRGNYCPDGCE